MGLSAPGSHIEGLRWGHAGQTVAGVTVREAPSNHLGTTTVVVVQHFKETERERTERDGDRVGGKYHGYCNRWLSNKTVASVEWGEGATILWATMGLQRPQLSQRHHSHGWLSRHNCDQWDQAICVKRCLLSNNLVSCVLSEIC